MTRAIVPSARLATDWFQRDVVTVARDLVGTILVYGTKAGVIVETEAYLGPEDLASHTRFGLTDRNAVMFGPGGVAYVYLCYGVHEMFNIVTGEEGDGQAVLIRAVAPHVGLPDDPRVGRGPGKVTKALALSRKHDRRDLARGDLYVAPRPNDVAPTAIARGPRIGVDYAGDWADKPFRFWWKDHPAVSGSAGTAGRTVSTRRKR